MTLSADKVSKVVSTVRDVARQEILPRFRSLAAEDIDQKSGPADLVTIADRRAEEELTRRIHAFWPEVVIIGEEAVESGKAQISEIAHAEWGLVIDPVDGTWNFAKGLAVFGVLISVLHKGVTVWSMLYDPSFDDWVEATRGKGSAFVTATHHRALRFNPGTADSNCPLGYVPLHMFPAENRPKLASEFIQLGRIYNLHCSAHEYRMLALGHVDFVVAWENKVWDHLPGALAVTEAGGHVANLDGTAYTVSSHRGKQPLISARNRDVWDAVAETLRRGLA